MKTLSVKFGVTIIISFVLLSVSLANANLRYKDYNKYKDTQPFRLYIEGIGESLLWANAISETNGNSPLYCPPGKLTLTTDNYLQILKNTIEKNKGQIKEDDPIPMLLLKGLMETFPCKK